MRRYQSIALACAVLSCVGLPATARGQASAPPNPQPAPTTTAKPASGDAPKTTDGLVRSANPNEAGTKARSVQANIACPDCHGVGTKTYEFQVNLPHQKYKMETRTETCKSCKGHKIAVPTSTVKIPTWMNFLRQTALAVARADPNHADYDKMRVAVSSALRASIGKHFEAVACVVNPEEERTSQIVSGSAGAKKNAPSGMAFAGKLIREESVDGSRLLHIAYSPTRGDYRTVSPGDGEIVVRNPAFVDAAINDPVLVGGAFVERQNGAVILQFGFVLSASELPEK